MAQDALAIESVTGSSKSVWWVDSLLVFAGLVLLLLGARWFLFGAVSLAQWLGISELVIGLTVVAVGTSLPEVVTSVVASIRGERDIAVGNVVGSNLFNLLGVLGLATMFSTGGIVVEPSVISRDLPVMFFAAVACLPIFFTGGRISRWEGGFLLASYLVYTVYVILDATRHPLFAEFGWMTRRVIVPVVVLAVVWIIVKAIRESALTGPRIRDNP
jgi:cation:H+ antiporter